MKKKKKNIKTLLKERNGMDALGGLIALLILICAGAGYVLRFPALSILAVILVVYLFFRTLSGKKELRKKENMIWIGMLEHWRFRRQSKRVYHQLKSENNYKRCPHCRKTYRIWEKMEEEERVCPYCNHKNS